MNFQPRMFGCTIPETASKVSPACNYNQEQPMLLQGQPWTLRDP